MTTIVRSQKNIIGDSAKFPLPDVCAVGVSCGSGSSAEVWVCLDERSAIADNTEDPDSWFKLQTIDSDGQALVFFDPAPAGVQVRNATGTVNMFIR